MQFTTMAKPVGSRCNMNCSYCYYLHADSGQDGIGLFPGGQGGNDHGYAAGLAHSLGIGRSQEGGTCRGTGTTNANKGLLGGRAGR